MTATDVFDGFGTYSDTLMGVMEDVEVLNPSRISITTGAGTMTIKYSDNSIGETALEKITTAATIRTTAYERGHGY